MGTSNKRLQQVLSYANERGDEEACKFFDIKYSTLQRYRRRAREREIDISREYDNPKILLLDIETSPIEIETWELGKQYIDDKLILKSWSIISWAAKWLCDSKIMGEKVNVKEAIDRKDKRILEDLWELLEEADIIMAHNLKYFDEKKIKSRFILNGMDPVSPYDTIDTYRQVKKEFRFLSNKLDYLGKILADMGKIDTTRELWTRCIKGDKKALKEMLRYNKQDIRVLEEVYFKIRPWIHSHPNLGLYYKDMANRCPNCGSKDITLNGDYYTPSGRYHALKCNNCGAYGRERYHNLDTDQRKNLLRSTAR